MPFAKLATGEQLCYRLIENYSTSKPLKVYGLWFRASSNKTTNQMHTQL
jgi:hypothetical protein